MLKHYASTRASVVFAGGGRGRQIEFVEGRYSTDDPKKQERIETSSKFNQTIFLATTDEEEEELIKIAAQEDASDPDSRVACEICGKEFETTKQLRGHTISHKR